MGKHYDNIEADPSLNLLAIEVVVIGLLTSIHFVGLIYKKLYLDIIEASFILNLGILAAATFYVSQVAVSVSRGRGSREGEKCLGVFCDWYGFTELGTCKCVEINHCYV